MIGGLGDRKADSKAYRPRGSDDHDEGGVDESLALQPRAFQSNRGVMVKEWSKIVRPGLAGKVGTPSHKSHADNGL